MVSLQEIKTQVQKKIKGLSVLTDQQVFFFHCFIIHVAPLIEAVFLEYARLLESLGLSRGMRYYCNLAGGKGTMLLEEHFSPQKRDIP